MENCGLLLIDVRLIKAKVELPFIPVISLCFGRFVARVFLKYTNLHKMQVEKV